MPDRQAQQRLDEWRGAERAEAETEPGSASQRRAKATSRRARWAFEDAARAAGRDHGAPPESFDTTMRRALTRLGEASKGAAAIGGRRKGERREPPPETQEQRGRRRADEAEIERELGEERG